MYVKVSVSVCIRVILLIIAWQFILRELNACVFMCVLSFVVHSARIYVFAEAQFAKIPLFVSCYWPHLILSDGSLKHRLYPSLH